MRHILQTGCLILGVLCLFYYAGIVLYAGITADFAWIWALGGIFLLTLHRLLIWQEIHPEHWIRYVTGVSFMLIGLAMAVVLILGSRIAGAMFSQPEPDLDYVIVLGAQVHGTKPSRALRKRLDRAFEYVKENPDTVLILSGGRGPDEGISEAECMYNYLTEQGMDSDRLLLEDRSTSTRENLQYSEKYLDKQHDRIGILSNNFHIFRAVKLAGENGYENVCGIPAPSDPFMQLHYVLREICALLVNVKKHN